MKALSFWKAVTMDKAGLLEEVFALLRDSGIRFCVTAFTLAYFPTA
jgi:hypothetical protein